MGPPADKHRRQHWLRHRRWRSTIQRTRRTSAVELLHRAAVDFSAHRGTIYAAAISYYALFSLFPLLILLTALFSWLAGGTELQARLIDLIVDQLPPGANLRPQIETVVRGASQTSSGALGLAGLIGTIWTASGVFSALRRALNLAFDVPAARSYIAGRLVDLLAVAAVTVLVLLSIGATAGLGLVRAATDDRLRGGLLDLGWAAIFFLLPFVISYVVFLLVYRLIPNLQIPFRYLRVGALLAAFGFELVKLGFALYLANFGHYQQIYGALGGVVAFLFFVYLSSCTVIFAAELASELAKDQSTRRRPS